MQGDQYIERLSNIPAPQLQVKDVNNKQRTTVKVAELEINRIAVQAMWAALVCIAVIMIIFNVVGFALLASTHDYWNYGSWAIYFIVLFSIVTGVVIWKGYQALAEQQTLTETIFVQGLLGKCEKDCPTTPDCDAVCAMRSKNEDTGLGFLGGRGGGFGNEFPKRNSPAGRRVRRENYDHEMIALEQDLEATDRKIKKDEEKRLAREQKREANDREQQKKREAGEKHKEKQARETAAQALAKEKVKLDNEKKRMEAENVFNEKVKKDAAEQAQKAKHAWDEPIPGKATELNNAANKKKTKTMEI